LLVDRPLLRLPGGGEVLGVAVGEPKVQVAPGVLGDPDGQHVEARADPALAVGRGGVGQVDRHRLTARRVVARGPGHPVRPALTATVCARGPGPPARVLARRGGGASAPPLVTRPGAGRPLTRTVTSPTGRWFCDRTSARSVTLPVLVRVPSAGSRMRTLGGS